jgi:hypothetical protein
MGISTSTKCDICEIERKETNHWFMVFVMNNEPVILIRPFDLKVAADNEKYTSTPMKVCCGQSCLSKYLSLETARLFQKEEASE